jgi:hypothetical protein
MLLADVGKQMSNDRSSSSTSLAGSKWWWAEKNRKVRVNKQKALCK